MTSLYIKRHRATHLLYLGKTVEKDVHRYKGSGIYWKRHLTQHGYDVETVWFEAFEDTALLQECAEFLSEFFDVAASKNWANIIPENGFDGTPYGVKATEQHKANMSKARAKLIWCNDGNVNRAVEPQKVPPGWALGMTKGRVTSDDLRRKRSEIFKGRVIDEEWKLKLRGRVWINDGVEARKIKKRRPRSPPISRVGSRPLLWHMGQSSGSKTPNKNLIACLGVPLARHASLILVVRRSFRRLGRDQGMPA